jgi:ABC-type branched-subunit amino acid transport system substrate-binding protein
MNNSTARKNPYIIGRPIYEPAKFFGREKLFLFIEDNLNSNTKILLLHGQRRIGTSSVLQQIPHKLAQDKFVFVIFDLQGHSQSSLSDILHKLSEAIAESLAELNLDTVTPPSEEQLQNNQDIFSHDFLPRVYQRLGDKKLVLLLDEFDVISSDDNILNHDQNFFRYLQSLLKQQQKLFIIPAVRGGKDDLQKLLDLFNKPPSQKVDLLDQLNARRLITEPAQNMLEYEEDAIKAILELSSAHPYFTQAICFNLFLQAKIEDRLKVSRSDVKGIVDKTIESVTGGLTWFWDGLSLNEKVVFSAVAEAQKIDIEQEKLFPEDWLMLLKKYGVIPTSDLIKAVKNLTINTFLDETERQVKIELVRHWLVERRPLQKTIWKLEELRKEEINPISEEAAKLHQDGKNQDAIGCYEKILEFNPNHFSTLPILADRYLEIDNFDKALKLYQRAYQIDSIRNKEGFLLALEAYGNYLIKEREFIKAKFQFEEVLKIEPDRDSAKYKLREVEAEIEQQEKLDRKIEIYEQELEIKQLPPPKTPVRQGVRLGIIAGVLVLLAGSIGVKLFYSSRTHLPITHSIPPSPTPNDNIQSNISRGDRTLFTTIPNPSRDQGIEAFKKNNYAEAENYFNKAFRDKNNPPDPEVLIYQNNARAIQQGNPLTLAVVIPAENALDTAREILRGVAQAQNQFNMNGGFNNRLLKVTIANDANNLEQAKQIAEQLVNDKSLLGVIGHTTSDATQAALDVYKKADISIISPTISSNNLKGNVLFRVVPSNAVSSEKLAKYATNQSLNKVVIFYNPKSKYSNSLNKEFQINFKGKGEIFRQIDLTDPKLNIEKELKDSASQRVQAVMLFPDVEHTATAIDIAKVNTNNRLRLKLLGGSTLYTQKILQNGGNDIKGLVITVPWFYQLPQAKNFSQTANELWRGVVSWRTATSYDATQAFLEAIKESFPNVSRETILQKLPEVNLSPKETSGDILKFKNGERQIEPILIQFVEKGKFQILK